MVLANDFKKQWLDIGLDARETFEDFGDSGWYILGNELADFERDLAKSWQHKHVVGVASGLDALEISLRILGCGAGDLVLTTPLSAFATTLAITKIKSIPVFVDVDENGAIDLDLCEEVLRSRPDIRYFVPVHLYGYPLSPQRLRALRDQYKLKIVEDCAQSILAEREGEQTGCVGQMAATSFYPTKNLGGFGDGGAILTDDEEFARQARALRDYGQTGKYEHEFIGYNSRLDELQAALLRRVCLPRLAGWTARRREIAGLYLSGIVHPAITIHREPEGASSCWHLFPVFVSPALRPDFIRHLKQSGVASGVHYPTAIPDQPALCEVPFEVVGDCAVARRLCRSEVSLPIHPYLTDEQVGRVIETVNSWKPSF